MDEAQAACRRGSAACHAPCRRAQPAPGRGALRAAAGDAGGDPFRGAAGDDLPQSPRLRAGAHLLCLRLALRLSPLRCAPDLPPPLAQAHLPPLRQRAAGAEGVPGLRRGGTAPAGAGHRAARAGSGTALSPLPPGAHRPGYHQPEGQPPAAAGGGASGPGGAAGGYPDAGQGAPFPRGFPGGHGGRGWRALRRRFSRRRTDGAAHRAGGRPRRPWRAPGAGIAADPLPRSSAVADPGAGGLSRLCRAGAGRAQGRGTAAL